MKTTNQIEASAPANVRPSSVSKTGNVERKADLVRHYVNRGLSTKAVLDYLRTRLPRQYEIAEVVGKWVWLDVWPKVETKHKRGVTFEERQKIIQAENGIRRIYEKLHVRSRSQAVARFAHIPNSTDTE